MSAPGGLGGIYPAMVNGVLALRLLGYPDDHRLIAGQLKEIEALGIEGPQRPPIRPGTSFSGYGEGLGLYTEWLGTVMGIYETPN